MNNSRRWRIVACLVALSLVSGLTGGLLGYRLAWKKAAQRSNPAHWNETVMATLDRKLQLTPVQHTHIQAHLNAAVEELMTVRLGTIERSTNVVGRLVAQVDDELTPKQRALFAPLKPKPSDLSSLEMLKVEPRKP